jgi:hypothetical protein
MENGKSDRKRRRAPKLEVPFHPESQRVLMKKLTFYGGENGRLDRKFTGANGRRGEVKKADKTIQRSVFLAVDVGFLAVGNAVGNFLVAVLQQVVRLLQYDGLKDEHHQ